NKIKFNILSKFEYDKETSKITYALSDFSFEYEFKFVGLSIVFSKNGKSVSMSSGLDTAGENYQFFANCYKSEGSESFDGIKNIYLKYNKDNTSITLEYDNGKTNRNCIAELTTDGLFTITIPNESGNKTYQFAMFYCESDGLILCDGEKTYYYNTNFSDQYSNKLENNLTIEDAKSLENMSKEKIEKILKEKQNLAADLSAAFSSAGLNVDVDEVNGEISMDTSVLFGGDQAIITDAGKQLLNKFVGVYTSVVFNEKYNGFVSKIMVEGHTAPISGGTYESGLPLSEERANNVKAYCISSETGLNAANTNSLSSTMVSVGLSNSKPVKNEDNSVNMQASRRVSFRFIVNVK
ncbi:MAG: OmpA family protein, partial [Oscillospiraceae bacterium]